MNTLVTDHFCLLDLVIYYGQPCNFIRVTFLWWLYSIVQICQLFIQCNQLRHCFQIISSLFLALLVSRCRFAWKGWAGSGKVRSTEIYLHTHTHTQGLSFDETFTPPSQKYSTPSITVLMFTLKKARFRNEKLTFISYPLTVVINLNLVY